jgi:F-type H+-transporting ATPase subunit epsilon
MAGGLLLEIATPERMLLKEHVSEVEAPGAEGALGILPEHAPLLSELAPGTLKYTPGGVSYRKCLSIMGGWLEVLPDRVRVLATAAEFADEVDVQRAEQALQRANERLLHPVPGVDVARALSAAQRARARLDAARHSHPAGK